MPPRHTYTNFLNCHYFGKWALSFCFNLAKVFLQGANTTPFFQLSLFWEVGVILLRISQGIYSGCHHATPTHFFRNCYYGKPALRFCFELAKVFLQDATTPSLHHFFELSLFWELGIMLLLRLNQGISSGCHHATPTITNNSGLPFWWEGGINVSRRLLVV